jgi:hypothetical protein
MSKARINEASVAFRYVRFCLNVAGHVSNTNIVHHQPTGHKSQKVDWLHLVIEHLRKNERMKIGVEHRYFKICDFHQVKYINNDKK